MGYIHFSTLFSNLYLKSIRTWMLTGPIWLVFGSADSSTGLSAQDCEQGTEPFWLLSEPPRCKAAPARHWGRSVRCCAGASEPCVGSDSKSLPRNYLVPWSELMICVWLLSSRTTQHCNRVFGSFYVLDQGLCIILCLQKDF